MRVRLHLLLLVTALAAACGQKGPLRVPGPRPATAVPAPAVPAEAPATDAERAKRTDPSDAAPRR